MLARHFALAVGLLFISACSAGAEKDETSISSNETGGAGADTPIKSTDEREELVSGVDDSAGTGGEAVSNVPTEAGELAKAALREREVGPSGPSQHLSRLEIKNILSNARIRPDPQADQDFVRFSEEFFPSGKWVSRRAERGPVVKRGTWRIYSDMICVSMDGDSTTCRKVWAGPRPGTVGLRDMGSSRAVVLVMLVEPGL